MLPPLSIFWLIRIFDMVAECFACHLHRLMCRSPLLMQYCKPVTKVPRLAAECGEFGDKVSFTPSYHFLIQAL